MLCVHLQFKYLFFVSPSITIKTIKRNVVCTNRVECNECVATGARLLDRSALSSPVSRVGRWRRVVSRHRAAESGPWRAQVQHCVCAARLRSARRLSQDASDRRRRDGRDSLLDQRAAQDSIRYRKSIQTIVIVVDDDFKFRHNRMNSRWVIFALFLLALFNFGIFWTRRKLASSDSGDRKNSKIGNRIFVLLSFCFVFEILKSLIIDVSKNTHTLKNSISKHRYIVKEFRYIVARWRCLVFDCDEPVWCAASVLRA